MDEEEIKSIMRQFKHGAADSEWKQFIKSIKITNIHGWTGQEIAFDFPVVAIVGENGIGTDSTLTTCSFVNAEGKTTVAINRGYAVMEQLKNVKGQVIEERYFDADGNPVKLYDSYYGIKYEYHDHELALR